MVHVVGAGLAGLSTAVRIAASGRRVAVYEGAGQAGGRCRSYEDARLGRRIDNGNHLVLSGNHAALAYLDLIGSKDQLRDSSEPVFPFVDLATDERWAVRPNSGPIPWWIFVPSRRIPGTGVGDYLRGAALALAGPQETVADSVPAEGTMVDRFWDPFTIGVMNAPMEASSAMLLWTVIRETFGRGGQSCIPQFFRHGLADAFVDPAVAFIRERGGSVVFNERLSALECDDRSVTALIFQNKTVSVGPSDSVVLSVSPSQLAALLPSIRVPKQDGVIVNAHFRVDPSLMPDSDPPFLGVLNGATQWIFLRDDLISLTISAAGALGLDRDREDAMLPRLWDEVVKALQLPDGADFEAGRIVKEKRATFDQSPAAVGDRPGTSTTWRNLFLAGDVTDTGLPATIEGAIRSGERAAQIALKMRVEG
ncbi:MAG: hydroxysqualene dehydroxylase HpnE [Pseudomonadota bacterium]